MGCHKCEDKFELLPSEAKIHFMSDVVEVILKAESILKNLNLNIQRESHSVIIYTDNAKNFFEESVDMFEEKFTLLEMDSIKVFIEDEISQISLQAILSAKSLKTYINLIRDKDFFDILNTQSLTSHFQPIINSKDHKIYGYEALARGVKSNGELMSPFELFEKSDRNDMNFRLDRLCRESALKTAAAKKLKRKLFINFLPTTIYDPNFCLKSTVKWANQLEFDASNIVFEVVETEKVKDKKHLKSILTFYRDKGFQVALDDVGEGYSGLNMIIDLKPDIIKIDRKIIENIHEDTLKQSVYKALYELTREHGITILAEGIENPYELEMIKSIGVDLLQGFYFAKPTAEPIRSLKVL